MGRLCTGRSSEIGPKGRVSDDRERSKCSMVTGSAWRIMATYFWGLLEVDGCIQMFGGVRTGLLLCVFPLLYNDVIVNIYIQLDWEQVFTTY